MVRYTQLVVVDHRVLVKRDAPHGEIYAGCETYRRKALIKARGLDTVEEGWMYGIASVVTPKHLLRKRLQHIKTDDIGNGYATHLLRLLHYQLAEPSNMPPFPTSWGAPPPLDPDFLPLLPKAAGSILWSDIGSTFYANCTLGLDRPGWVVKDHQATELVWNILPSSDTSPGPSPWECIYQEDMPALSQEIGTIAQQEVSEMDTTRHSVYRPDPTSRGLLSFVPVRGIFSSTSKPPPNEPIGVRLRSSNTTVLFSAYNSDIGLRMLVYYTQNLQSQDLASLLDVLDRFANRAGRTEGWIWGLDLDGNLAHTWKNLPGREVKMGRRGDIKCHLLAVAWYGPKEEKGEFVDWQMWDWC